MWADLFVCFFLKDIATGKSVLFAPRLPAEYAVWLGEIKPLSYFKVIDGLIHFSLNIRCSRYSLAHIYVIHLQERYMVSSVFYSDEITTVLHDEYQGSGKPLLFLLHGVNTDSDLFSKPAEFQVNKSHAPSLSHISYRYLQNRICCISSCSGG